MGCCFSSMKGDDFDYDKSRKCTDKFWLFLFIFSWLILIITSVYSLMKGDPTRIIFGYDSFGNVCGQKNRHIKGVNWSGMDMTNKPYVFHMNPRNTSYSLKICVKKCAGFKMNSDADLHTFYENSNSTSLFRYDYDIAADPTAHYRQIQSQELAERGSEDARKGFGPAPIYPVEKQRPVLNRCVPTERIKLDQGQGDKAGLINRIYSYITNTDMLQKIFSDIYISRYNIAYLVGIGILISLVVVFSIHYLASIVSAMIMITATLVMIVLTAFSWYIYYSLENKLKSTEFIEQLDEDLANSWTFMIISIFLTIVTIIVLAITYFMRSRINLMVALFDETASCFRSMPCLAIQPLWTTIVLILFFIFWSTILLAVSTAENEIVFNSTTTRFQLKLPARVAITSGNGEFLQFGAADRYYLESVKHSKIQAIKYIWVFLFFMLFWTSEFILGCQQMTVAASVATWYFCRDKSTLKCTVGNSIYRILSHHLGSVALGSFLLVLFKIPRILLLYVEYQFQKVRGKYRCIECALSCCHCLWYILEKFIRYINHNAYTIIAIEGTPYCTSAQVAFSTLAANTARVVVINSIGDFILFLGKLIVTASVALVGMYFMRFETSVYYMAVPILFASIIAYFIAHAMLSVYEMVVDTMFLCYVEDVTKNANSPEGFYAPQSLLEFAAGEGINSASLRIARDVNPGADFSSVVPLQRQNKLAETTNGNDKPSIGFIYPQQVLESSH